MDEKCEYAIHHAITIIFLHATVKVTMGGVLEGNCCVYGLEENVSKMSFLSNKMH
jgi:hypothetical protein